MAIFKTVSDSHFEIDGVLYPKIFDLKKDGTNIILFNIYTEKWLDSSFKIGDITVQTKVRSDFASETLFLNELKSLVFKKGGGSTGEGVQTPTEIAQAIYIDEAAALAGGLKSKQYYHTGDYIIRIIQ